MLRSSLHCSPADTQSIKKPAERKIHAHRGTFQSILRVLQFATVGRELYIWKYKRINFRSLTRTERPLKWYAIPFLATSCYLLSGSISYKVLSHPHSVKQQKAKTQKRAQIERKQYVKCLQTSAEKRRLLSSTSFPLLMFIISFQVIPLTVRVYCSHLINLCKLLQPR